MKLLEWVWTIETFPRDTNWRGRRIIKKVGLILVFHRISSRSVLIHSPAFFYRRTGRITSAFAITLEQWPATFPWTETHCSRNRLEEEARTRKTKNRTGQYDGLVCDSRRINMQKEEERERCNCDGLTCMFLSN